MNPRVRGLTWGLGLSLLALSAAALLTGPAALSADQVLAVLMGKGSVEASLIVREIRLPRLLLALLVGAGLGASGAALQALLRNPLADPGVTGISASAALGAVLVFYCGGDAVAGLGLPLGGLLGALLGTLILLTLARRGAGTVTLILAGVALGSLASAATSLVLNLVPNPYAAYEIVFWLMGSLTDRALNHVWLIAPLLIPGLALLWPYVAFRWLQGPPSDPAAEGRQRRQRALHARIWIAIATLGPAILIASLALRPSGPLHPPLQIQAAPS
jgi:iron complex transport system permease protein